ncbi:MAG: EamA family transporter, partial [Proteobacteria bacterium]|nr:EamA family transporter [Pseudomonadota bacterium]
SAVVFTFSKLLASTNTPHQSLVLVIDKFSIVMVAILAFVFLGEKPLVKDWLGILLVASGLILIAIKR